MSTRAGYPPAGDPLIPTLGRINTDQSWSKSKLIPTAHFHQAEINLLLLLCDRNATIIIQLVACIAAINLIEG
jgi:hypothetical protein